MPTNSASLDEFFQNHAPRAVLLCTLEPVDSDRVKVTPWDDTGGCHCEASLTLHRRAIKSVTPTDKTHSCCGKQLRIAEIDLAEDLSDTLLSVFAQLRSRDDAPAVMAGGSRSARTRPWSGVCRKASSLCRRGDEQPWCWIWSNCLNDALDGDEY